MPTINRGVSGWLTLSAMLVLSNFASVGAISGQNVDQLRVKAEQGDSVAQFLLAAAYDRGRGVARNQVEAAAWYRKAAEHGIAEAQNSLGSLYQFGEGVAQNDTEAVKWYQKAVDQGHVEASTNLGYMYDMGLGVKQDKQKAAALYLAGADKGSLNAMLDLGVLYSEGSGVEKDLVEAYKWLELARFYTTTSPNMRLKWRVRGVLDDVKKGMTREQIDRGEQLAREWSEKHRSQ